MFKFSNTNGQWNGECFQERVLSASLGYLTEMREESMVILSTFQPMLNEWGSPRSYTFTSNRLFLLGRNSYSTRCRQSLINCRLFRYGILPSIFFVSPWEEIFLKGSHRFLNKIAMMRKSIVMAGKSSFSSGFFCEHKHVLPLNFASPVTWLQLFHDL